MTARTVPFRANGDPHVSAARDGRLQELHQKTAEYEETLLAKGKPINRENVPAPRRTRTLDGSSALNNVEEKIGCLGEELESELPLRAEANQAKKKSAHQTDAVTQRKTNNTWIPAPGSGQNQDHHTSVTHPHRHDPRSTPPRSLPLRGYTEESDHCAPFRRRCLSPHAHHSNTPNAPSPA